MGLALILLVALVMVVIAVRWLSSASRKRIRDATSRHDEVHQKIRVIEARVVDPKTQLDKNQASLRRQDFDAFLSTPHTTSETVWGIQRSLERVGVSRDLDACQLRVPAR